MLGIKRLKIRNLEPKNAQNGTQPFWEKALGDYHVIITLNAANQRLEFLIITYVIALININTKDIIQQQSNKI